MEQVAIKTEIKDMNKETANQVSPTGTAQLSSPGPFHDLLTEAELIDFLRIPEISKSQNFSNVIDNLVRMRNLPRVQLCNKVLFPRQAILEWIKKETKW